jgi:serine/threonine protein phosphatase PrpC
MKVTMQSNVGCVRQNNQDRADFRQDLNGLILAMVADGMGGHQAGEIASELTVNIIAQQLQHLSADMDEEECRYAILEAIHKANQQVYDKSQENHDYSGMGTTVVLVLASSEWVQVAHIGDSRCYLVSFSTIDCLTSDHSLVNELVRKGQISLSEAEMHPQRNVLLRALGTDEFVEVDVHRHFWQVGDQLLLCSDGLTNMVSEERIHQILVSSLLIEEKAETLIAEALEAGGEDNVTVVILAHV